MVYFQTKSAILGKFWSVLQSKMLANFMEILSILMPFCIFCGHFVYFAAILYILRPFCIFCGHFDIFFPFWSAVPRKIWQPWSAVSFIPRLLHAINQLLSLTKELPKQ
jgi:hypothetical protein